MAVAQAHPLARESRHGGSGVVIHDAKAQSVSDEKNHVVLARSRRLRKHRERERNR